MGIYELDRSKPIGSWIPDLRDEDGQCYDIDECAVSETRLNTCSPFSNCQNTDGSYTCTCTDGFTGDAIGPVGCRDIDECADNIAECDDYAECVNNDGGYSQGLTDQPLPLS